MYGSPRPRATHPAERAVKRHKIDQRRAGAELDQSERFLPLFDMATERACIKGQAPVDVAHPQHDMVDLLHGKRNHRSKLREALLQPPAEAHGLDSQREPLGSGLDKNGTQGCRAKSGGIAA